MTTTTSPAAPAAADDRSAACVCGPGYVCDRHETTHYVKGAPTNHFIGRCEECDAHYLAQRTLDEVDNYYRQGVVSQTEWEGYLYAWTNSAHHYADNWDAYKAPSCPSVERFGRMVAAAAGISLP